MTLIWPPDENVAPADTSQIEAANAFRQHGKITIEAPPGTGKTFLGVYLALCAYRLGWVSSESPALFLTFSRNARVQIEQELQRFRDKGWLNTEEVKAVKIYNYHAFYFEMIQQKAGTWGCSEKLRPASIQEYQTRLLPLLSQAQQNDKNTISQANLVYALDRFPIGDLLQPDTQLLIDDATIDRLHVGATTALREGRPQYDDFAPLLLNLLELCPELVEWVRIKYPVIILDEFQDTDVMQWEILQRINPSRIVILYDRYQMIYDWRGARSDRLEQVKNYFQIALPQEKQLTQIHRCGAQAELAQFILQLRNDDLIGNYVTATKNRPWLSMHIARPLARGMQMSVENRCLTWLRYNRIINFHETTAILTRTNFMAAYLFEHLRVRPNHGYHYLCRWIGGEDNPDEKVRDWLWQLKLVHSENELRSWLGTLLDNLLPRSLLNGLGLSFSSEFAKDQDQIFANRRKVLFQNLLTSWKPILDSLKIGDYQAILSGLNQVIITGSELVSGNGHLDPDLVFFINNLRQSVDRFHPSTNGDEWQEFCNYLENSHLRASFIKLRSPSSTGLYILTIHQSKGREFDHVIIPWLSNAGEPSQPVGDRRRRIGFTFSKLEDRKLLYVAITRAKRHVSIIYPEEDPSPFLTNWKLI
jgi:superfamily I DNA/RNA helicase